MIQKSKEFFKIGKNFFIFKMEICYSFFAGRKTKSFLLELEVSYNDERVTVLRILNSVRSSPKSSVTEMVI